MGERTKNVEGWGMVKNLRKIMIMIMMIMIRTITLSCSLSFVLVFAFLFSPFLQSQIWDVTPISKNAIFSPARTNATEANSCIRFRASNSGTQKKTHGIS